MKEILQSMVARAVARSKPSSGRSFAPSTTLIPWEGTRGSNLMNLESVVVLDVACKEAENCDCLQAGTPVHIMNKLKALLITYLLAVWRLLCNMIYQYSFIQGKMKAHEMLKFAKYLQLWDLWPNGLRLSNSFHLRMLLEDERFSDCRIVLLHAS